MTRLTFGETGERWPLWTPDGTRITFQSDDGVYWIPWDGTGVMERLAKTANSFLASWTPDGTTLAFVQEKPGDNDIWLLPKGGAPLPLLQSPFNERFPVFSPDGRWLAYGSNETGRREVYVRPYPGPGVKVQISSEGGVSPLWARSGKELLYLSLPDSDGMRSMMAVDIAAKLELRAGRPRLLFRHNYYASTPVGSYDVSPDGPALLDGPT